MNIYLKNVGIVKESNIVIDGLTVITGKNNSGKTTVGKVLYSLIDAVANLKDKVAFDRRNYLNEQLEQVESALEIFHMLFRPMFRREKDMMDTNSHIYSLFVERHRNPKEDIETFAHCLYEELQNFSMENIQLPEEADRYVRMFFREEIEHPEQLQEAIAKQINKALSILEFAFDNLQKDPELIQYTKNCIQRSLMVEFSDQVQPIRAPEQTSEIGLTSEGDICFSFEIDNNQIVNNGKRIYWGSPFKKVFFVDDPFAIDSFPYITNRRIRDTEYMGVETFFNANRVISHGDRLRRVLHSKVKPSILEVTILEERLKNIREKIDAILPGQFEFSSEGDYYVKDGAKLKISNLATGSKLFSIIKVLIDRGELDDSTVLILDEPEAHLHPQWQNAFAEIVVLLAKELGVKILLTTHSPNFMLALDAYMRKYEFAEKTNFYQTVPVDDYYVEYRCVNDNMELIYGDFLRYLSDAKALRDSYMYGMGEI